MFNKIEKKIDEASKSVKDNLEDVKSIDPSNLQDHAEKLAENGYSTMSDLKKTFSNKVEANPVGATFAGAFVGLVIGIFISRK